MLEAEDDVFPSDLALEEHTSCIGEGAEKSVTLNMGFKEIVVNRAQTSNP